MPLRGLQRRLYWVTMTFDISLLPMLSTVKNISVKASTALMLSMAGAQHAFAGVFGPIPDTGGGGDVEAAATSIIDAILNILGIIAVIVIIIAGLRLIVGGADEAQREKARNTVLYAVIGLILILFAKAIVQFVADNFSA